MNTTPDIGTRVREFYEAMPFNYYSSTEEAVKKLAGNPIASTYPDLDALLRSDDVASAMEFGCGAGWLSNTVAHHYGVPITGVDFTGEAVKRAREVSDSLGVAGLSEFIQSDIFDFESDGLVDLVISVGVLHHTHDARGAFERIQRFVKPGKFVYLGLYHHHGRKVFLDLFNEILAKESEEAAFKKYESLDAIRRQDAAHLESWFRDQVLHPHETQHTLKEVSGWLADSGFAVRSSSINRFQPISELGELFALEKDYERLSYQANHVEGRYFPGFFTVLAQRLS